MIHKLTESKGEGCLWIINSCLRGLSVIFSTLVVKQKSCKVVYTVNMVAYRIHHFTTPCGIYYETESTTPCQFNCEK